MKFVALFLSVLVLILMSLSVGPAHFNVFQLESDAVASLVFWDIRLPRAMAALWVGASLGLGGALLQTLLRNPLAEPYTLGLSGGASLGAVLAIALKIRPLDFSIPFLATIFCFGTAILVLSFSFKKSMNSSRNLILAGVMISLFFGSLVVLILSVLSAEQIQTALFWMMGQVGTERDSSWPFAAVAFWLAILWSRFNIKNLDRLLLGESVAQTLGTAVSSLSFQIIAVVSVLVAACVSVAGLIGFVGLLAPHLTKLLLKTHRHTQFIAGSALMGAVLLLTSDVLARIIGGDREIPTGGLVALIGAPTLIYLLLRRGSHVQG
jgi:iron complex transport system permease protein